MVAFNFGQQYNNGKLSENNPAKFGVKNKMASKKTVVKTTKKKKVKKPNGIKTKTKTLSKKRASNKGPKKIRAIKSAKKDKQKPLSILKRLETNPIILPKKENGWEAWQTFNPGAVLLENKVHFIYRAIGHDGLSRFGYASSKNGCLVDERLNSPIYEHQIIKQPFNRYSFYSYASGGSFGGAEDPRLTRIKEDGKIYMTYTACDQGLRVGLSSIKEKDFLAKNWKKWKKPVLISPPNEVHKNWVIFPEKIKGKYAVLHSVSPEISIAYLDDLSFENENFVKSYYFGHGRRKNCWDNWVRGVGAPPIKTRLGWLVFYHAMDEKDPGKYKVGVMILDKNNPENILYRSPKPVLEPEKPYENNGFKSGVVYLSGAVIKNEELFVYYGASDSYVGVARANLEKFLTAITKKESPKLKIKILKKK